MVNELYPSNGLKGLPWWLSGKERIFLHLLLGEGNGNPLQISCLGNAMDRGAWWALVHGVTHSWR